MSRILLTWELGLNLGHLTRLLPLAQRLRADGHAVLIASRDMQAAATVLGPAGIPFVQAPHLPQGIPLPDRPTGYADILLSQGWGDTSALWGLTQAWLNLLRMFGPEQLILDYSPTAGLAARIAKIPCLLIGNGFELPPVTDPLPPFPGFSWATADKACRSERLAVANTNRVLTAFGGKTIEALRDLVIDETRLFATFPELDHYGARPGEHYVGPLLGQLRETRAVSWPEGKGPRVFACLRPDTSHVQAILQALSNLEARVVCVVRGFTEKQVLPYKRDHLLLSDTPVDLSALGSAELCISYGAEGTMMKFLLEGTPQLVAPWHVEAFMAGRKLQEAGLGESLEVAPTVGDAMGVIERLASDSALHERAARFAASAVGAPRSEPLQNVIDSLSYNKTQLGARCAGPSDRRHLPEHRVLVQPA